jgi:hypothetical protein
MSDEINIETLKKAWIGEICECIKYGDERELIMSSVSQDIYSINDKRANERLTSINFKNKNGQWYTGSLSKYERLPEKAVTLVVDVVRDVHSRPPRWAAIILFKEQFWMMNLKYLMIYKQE